MPRALSWTAIIARFDFRTCGTRL